MVFESRDAEQEVITSQSRPEEREFTHKTRCTPSRLRCPLSCWWDILPRIEEKASRFSAGRMSKRGDLITTLQLASAEGS